MKVKNSLNLIEDEKGLLPLKTRLSNHPALNYNVTHPILLQTDSYFTTLVINHHLIYGRSLASKRTDKEIKEYSSDDYIKSCKKLKANISYFENKFKNECLTALQERHTYLNKCKNNAVEEILRIGDVVLLKEDNKPRLSWRKGKKSRH